MTSGEYYHSRFPGEDFLAVELPDFAQERRQLVQIVIAVVIQFVFVLPYFLATKKVTPASNDSASLKREVLTDQSASSEPEKRRRSGRRNGKKDKQKQPRRIPPTDEDGQTEDEVAVEFSAAKSNVLTLLGIVAIFGVLFSSDSNLFAARAVVVAPVFTKEECRKIIEMAHRAAGENARIARKEKDALLLKQPRFMDAELSETAIEEEEEAASNKTAREHLLRLNKLDTYLKEPSGWKKDRHSQYPTTDLNFVTDPFTPEDRSWLANKLNGRLAPIVERSFGIFRGAIRANDIFVVRYDADKGQPNLRRHTDDAHLSFNILLNDEFQGGGTRFHSRYDKSHIDVSPSVGEALITYAKVLHEGLTTSEGTRYILVGFNSIDEKDPLTGERTNLSLFSSWLNFSWMQVRFKDGFQDGARSRREISQNSGDDLEGKWKYSRYAVDSFRDLSNAMIFLVDVFAKFHLLKVVDTDDLGPYFQVLDAAAQQRTETETKLGIAASRATGYASWYKGQQIDLDVFGNLKSRWKSRKDEEDRFRGEDL